MSVNKSAAIAFRKRVLNFWFSNNRWSLTNDDPPARAAPVHPSDLQRWFGVSQEFDAKIRENFEKDLEFLINDQYRYPNDIDEPEHLLACIIALDQFPRNIYRNNARAFDYDQKAKQLSCEMIDKAADQKLPYLERTFIYLPFEHSEDLDDQNRSVNYLKQLCLQADQDPSVQEAFKNTLQLFVKYAEQHRRVVEQFGRFPHRNAALHRPSTKEEELYLNNGGERFGQ